jgi:signal transduction histidine kinase
VDAAAVRARRDLPAESGATLSAELASRAASIARGEPRKARSALLPREVRSALQAAEERARLVPDGLGEAAALDFLAGAVAAIAAEERFGPGEARAAVTSAAESIGLPPEAAAFLVFRRALACKESVQLPPTSATDLVLALVVGFARVSAASLWVLDRAGRTTCLAAHGKSARSRALREVGRAALDGVLPDSGRIRAQLVERWDRPYAVLVVRGVDGDPTLEGYLADAATALAPILERAATVDRKLRGERNALGPGERRLARLGFDLHDGPLQEIVALAEELRLASQQIESVVSEEDRARVNGRFDDLHARLASLDESLRQIAQETRSTSVAARPVEEALESELEALERATGIATELAVEGDVSELTDSQKIVLFRVVQEAVSNIRKHSGARRASVLLRSTQTFLDLTVSDDGCGFDPRDRICDRLGLAGISERVRLLGGVVEIDSRPGAGTSVRATVPQWRPSLPDQSLADLTATGW